jgi:dienelactone hydrolase
LARRGFAVLRYDKRGVYQSSGNYATATSADFSRDAVAAHDYLAERPDIDPAKIGYIGHSQGSGVAARAVVAGGGQSGFVVSMAGVGLAPIETLVLQDGTEMAAAGASAAEVATLREFSRKFYATALEGADETTRTRELRALYDALTGTVRETVTRWYGEYGSETYSLNVDVASRDAFVAEKKGAAPTIFWSAVRAPVLVLNGARDSQVPADEHVSAILRALHEQPTNDVDSRIFAGLNHMFQTATTGATDEYSEIDETVSPEVLEVIAGWLIDTTK